MITVKHRSFLAPVANNSAFTVTSYPLNPGMASTFPWLHKLARRYEEYRVRKLRFEYRSVTATATAGVIMMSFDYDAADDPPASKQVQAQTIPNSECNAWMNNDLEVPCEGGFRYVRAGTLAPNLDIKTYDMGQMFLSSIYGAPVTTSGELYIEYEIELRRPTDGPETGGTINFSSNGAAANAPFGTSVPTSTLGVAQPLIYLSSVGLTCTQSGEYMVCLQTNGTGLGSPVLPTITPLSSGSGSAIKEFFPGFGSATRVLTFWACRLQAGDVIIWNGLSSATTVTSVVLKVGTAPYASI
jgi:hypothetical protein